MPYCIEINMVVRLYTQLNELHHIHEAIKLKAFDAHFLMVSNWFK